jgi:glutamine synthetase
MNSCRETFEYRGPDPLANPYLLFAGITIAIKYGFENPKEALKIAEDLHAEETGKRKRLKNLPRSCHESAKNLRKDRKFYEAENVFPKILIDKTIDKLKAYKDKDLWKNLADKPEKVENVLKQYLHNG